MHTKIRDIDVYDVGNVSRVTANLDLADDLLQHSLLLANSDRLANKMERNRDFDFLTLDQPLKVGMDQTHSHWMDLTVAKHHLTWADTLDIECENRVSSSFRAQNCRQFLQRRGRGNSFRIAAINDYRYHAFAASASRIILSPADPSFGLDRYLVFFRHDVSLQTFSDRGTLTIADCQLPILKVASLGDNNRQLQFGNRQCLADR